MSAKAEGETVQAEAKVRGRLMLSCPPVVGGRGPEPTGAGGPRKLGKARQKVLP